jgi:hypothetical protein
MPSRDVAKAGVDALAGDPRDGHRGPAQPGEYGTVQLIPNRFLLPLLAKQHPALRRKR